MSRAGSAGSRSEPRPSAPATAWGWIPTTSATGLNTEVGPPVVNYGCCTAVGQLGSADKIGSLPGNKADADCTSYAVSGTIVNVPVFDTAGGTGANAWYHVIGYTGFQITGCPG